MAKPTPSNLNRQQNQCEAIQTHTYLGRLPMSQTFKSSRVVTYRALVLLCVVIGSFASISTSMAAKPKQKNNTALPKKWQPVVKANDWKFLVLHHSATKAGSVKSIDAAHRQRKTASGIPWKGIGYHFVIGNGNSMADGKVEPTFRWTKQISGAHAGSNKYNQEGIGICLIGNFENTKPTKLQLQAVKDLTKQLAKRFKIPAKSIVGHRDVRATKCPGKNFPLKEIREFANIKPKK